MSCIRAPGYHRVFALGTEMFPTIELPMMTAGDVEPLFPPSGDRPLRLWEELDVTEAQCAGHSAQEHGWP